MASCAAMPGIGGDALAHTDRRHAKTQDHHHPHAQETAEWLVEPFPHMTAKELNTLLMERSNELDHSIEDEKGAIAEEAKVPGRERVVALLEKRLVKMEKNALQLRASRIAVCKKDTAGTVALRGEEQVEGTPIADESKHDDDEYHRFMVNLCILYDVTPIRPGKAHSVCHVVNALIKGAPYWSILSCVAMVVGAVWSAGTVGTLTTAVEALGFGAATQASRIFTVGLIVVIVTDCVALVACILMTGHSVHTACGKHGACRCRGPPRHHRPRHNADSLLKWGLRVEGLTALLCYLSAVLMFFATAFVTSVWAIITLLTGVCHTKKYQSMGNILALLPEDLTAQYGTEDMDPSTFAANIESYCSSAKATCLEDYDPDGFFNRWQPESVLAQTKEERCAADPTEQYEYEAWAMLMGATVILFAQVNLVMRSGVGVFQVNQEIREHDEAVASIDREKRRKIQVEVEDAEAEVSNATHCESIWVYSAPVGFSIVCGRVPPIRLSRKCFVLQRFTLAVCHFRRSPSSGRDRDRKYGLRPDGLMD